MTYVKPRDADAAAIKDAFRKLALQYHPDRNKAPGAEERFKEIAEPDAVLGAEIAVPTLDGEIAVKVPPGTQPDAQLRLRGKGLPRFGARGRGDLYLRLAVRRPERSGRGGACPVAAAARAAAHSIVMWRRFDFSALGSVSSSTPSFIAALALASSTSAGTASVREKAPRVISQR